MHIAYCQTCWCSAEPENEPLFSKCGRTEPNPNRVLQNKVEPNRTRTVFFEIKPNRTELEQTKVVQLYGSVMVWGYFTHRGVGKLIVSWIDSTTETFWNKIFSHQSTILNSGNDPTSCMRMIVNIPLG